MSLAFVPRTVAHSKVRAVTGVAEPVRRDLPSSSTSSTLSTDPTPSPNAALLLALALSDHALWTTPALRDPNRDGWIALSGLIATSPPFVQTSPCFSDLSVVKSIRAHAPDAYDVRIIVLNSARAGGGYEVRRRDWADVVDQFAAFDRAYWHARTLYIENIPHHSRSHLGIALLLADLLSSHPRTLQSVVFPHHYHDPPSATPKCKGFALVTFVTPEHGQTLLAHWPWRRSSSPSSREDDERELAREAQKAGFRVLPRDDWEALQAEYIAYRDALLASSAVDAPPTPTAPALPSLPQHEPPPPPTSTSAGPPHILTPTSPYPPACVLVVRHVLPSTNKTALRALFVAPLPVPSALDYVDFTKGLDICYLRLAAPEHAQTLLAYFAAHPTVQTSDPPAPAHDLAKPLALELLDGRKEELYWAQVPEKVRKQAVAKALEDNEGRGGEEDGGRRRKRRK